MLPSWCHTGSELVVIRFVHDDFMGALFLYATADSERENMVFSVRFRLKIPAALILAQNVENRLVFRLRSFRRLKLTLSV